ncbi:MAG: hypothetical protein ACFE9M_10005 [Promethearchaeota archaeon]
MTMIFQGLFNILELYLNNIDFFYNNINNHFKAKIIENYGNKIIEKEDLDTFHKNLCLYLINYFIELGFEQTEIENKFTDPYLELKDEEKDNISSTVDLYEKKIDPFVYEIFLEKIITYLVEEGIAPLMLKFKNEGFLTLEFIMELRNLKTLIEKVPEKMENLRKYIHIQEKLISKIRKNKNKIESLEDLEEPQYKLQLIYLIYRIIEFFHLQKMIDFSHIKSYLEKNVDEWLIDVPLVSLKNPDTYFCGIYLAKSLNVKLDKNKITEFLSELLEEAQDRYESPLIEATDGAYYFFKSTMLMKLWLNHEQINKLVRTEPRFFEPNYLQNLETSQLVVILKLYRQLGVSEMEDEIKAILEEIETRISPQGIRQYRDGFITSEATYYVLFLNYMLNTLEKLTDFKLLNNIVQRIYRNLELLDISVDTNYDLISELFYSIESLKLLNCIETKEMIIHLVKYLFPEEVVNKILTSEEIARGTARFRHLKVNRITGETI